MIKIDKDIGTRATDSAENVGGALQDIADDLANLRTFALPAGQDLSANGNSGHLDAGGPSVFYIDNYGAKHDGATDDTAAFQAAVNAAIGYAKATRGQATLVFGEGEYLISGPIINGTKARSQIQITDVTTQPISFRMIGKGIKRGTGDQIGGTITDGTIIRSTLTGVTYDATRNPPAIFAVDHDPSGFAFSQIYVQIEDICFRAPDNPSLGGVDCRYATSAKLKHVRVDTNVNYLSISQPTHFHAVGIAMPGSANFAYNDLDHCYVSGYACGYAPGEHLITYHCHAYRNLVAVGLIGTGSGHNQVFIRLSAEHHPRILSGYDPAMGSVNATGNWYCKWENFVFEDTNDASWATLVNHVRDGGSAINGMIWYAGTKQGGTRPLISVDSANTHLFFVDSASGKMVGPTSMIATLKMNVGGQYCGFELDDKDDNFLSFIGYDTSVPGVRYNVNLNHNHRFLHNGVQCLDLVPSGQTAPTGLVLARPIMQATGASIASATTVTLGEDGDIYTITGTTPVSYFKDTRVRQGIFYVRFASAGCVVNHNAGAPGSFAANILLNGSAAYTSVAGAVLAFLWDGTNYCEIPRRT